MPHGLSKVPRREWLPRAAALVYFTGITVRRAFIYDTYASPWVWGLELLHTLLMAFAYLARRPLQGRAEGFWERYFPFLIPALTFVILYRPVTHPEWQGTAQVFLGLGILIQCIGVWTLRRSFSIMAEAHLRRCPNEC